MSREARQRQLNSAMWLGVTRAPPPSLTTHSIHDRPALVEIDEFLLESEDEVLSRDKRQTGSGDSDAGKSCRYGWSRGNVDCTQIEYKERVIELTFTSQPATFQLHHTSLLISEWLIA